MHVGIPKKLLAGFLAIAIFMTGDGFDLTFLSKYIVDLGFSTAQASMLFTLYGLFAAIAGWTSGVLAEMFGAKRIMMIGAASWITLHLVFIAVALPSHSYPLILASYGIRGIGYPLFIYSFVVLIAQTTDPSQLASAMGWFWTSYSIGIGVLGAYLPSFIIPFIGEYHMLWVSLPFAIVGTLICFLLLPKTETSNEEQTDSGDRLRALARGATILAENRVIALAAVVRVICNLTLYGFPVIMPLYLATRQYEGAAWFQVADWMRFWAVQFTVTVFGNVFWGRMGDKHGWMRQMRWWGCGLCAVGTLSFYYIPQFFGASRPLMYVAAVVVGMGISAFVPMGAIFPALAPEHKGAAISAHSLASGLTTFCGPAIATVLMPVGGFRAVVWTYALLYVTGAVITLFIRPKQPGFDASGRRLPPETAERELAETAANPSPQH